jgi:hypothetical protein
MTLPPRAILVHRRTEFEELIDRHGTRGHAAFFLSIRGRSIDDAERRHQAIKAAITSVSAAVPADWRRAMVERSDLPRWSFSPGGQPTHQTARYTLAVPDGRSERQASSGLIVCTGTGATGWGRSVWLERHGQLDLPGPADRQLSWFVREAWPSPATGTACTDGALAVGDSISVSVESDRLVAFSDGIESDAITVAWGQRVSIGLADRTLRLVR